MGERFGKLKAKIHNDNEFFDLIAELMYMMSELKKPTDFHQQIIAKPTTAKMYKALIKVGFSSNEAEKLTDDIIKVLFSTSKL
ncbi:hypothetical protein KAI92_03510 [Candidatus Parcubacteria bacterium]|nr:hypothetical protein [Candidatus Parcubacteria bacterium]